MKKLALCLLVMVVAGFQYRPFMPHSNTIYSNVIAQWGGNHYIRAGEFVGRSENQKPTTNTAALSPYVCQHDLIIRRMDVWGQVHGPYNASIWMANRDSYVKPPKYNATAMSVFVANTTNVAATEENPVYCNKGDFLLIHIDTDVNPEYLTVFAQIDNWNP